MLPTQPRFWLGTHKAIWLTQTDVGLFISRRTLAIRSKRRPLPVSIGPWVLDSGGFTELNLNGRWSITTKQYAQEVRRYADEIGSLEWVAPMDWMCEPGVRLRTGKTTDEHLALTVRNFLELQDELGSLVAPVVQGWDRDDYMRSVELFDSAGVDLASFPVVGVGSVCRRGATEDIVQIITDLHAIGIRCHGFGVKGAAFRRLYGVMESADSMAWSMSARYRPALPECTHRNCANCIAYALAWRKRLLEDE